MRTLKTAGKALGTLLLFLVVALCLALTIVPVFLDNRYYDGPRTSHFDGQRFLNPDGANGYFPPSNAIRADFLSRLIGGGDLPWWPEHLDIAPARPAAHAKPGEMRVTWVGHATVLIQAGGVNILTDPVWSDVVSPVPPIGPRRVAQPGIRFDDLPKIDIILISHNHYDHFDLPTLTKLWKRDRALIAVPLGNDTLLRAAGIPARALDWNQSLTVGPTQVISVRSHHWDSRWGTDRNRALWSAWVVRTPAGNIWFGGDTGPGDMRWAKEAARHGPFRLALIPVGGFRFSPDQMVNANHIGPREAVQVFRDLGASSAMPIHWGTFRLSMEGYATAPAMLDLFLKCAAIPRARFHARRIGEDWAVPPYLQTAYPADMPADARAPCREGSPALAALK